MIRRFPPGLADGQGRSGIAAIWKARKMTSDYLLRPLRSYEEAMRDIERQKSRQCDHEPAPGRSQRKHDATQHGGTGQPPTNAV